VRSGKASGHACAETTSTSPHQGASAALIRRGFIGRPFTALEGRPPVDQKLTGRHFVASYSNEASRLAGCSMELALAGLERRAHGCDPVALLPSEPPAPSRLAARAAPSAPSTSSEPRTRNCMLGCYARIIGPSGVGGTDYEVGPLTRGEETGRKRGENGSLFATWKTTARTRARTGLSPQGAFCCSSLRPQFA
jgi:hypothetical protein